VLPRAATVIVLLVLSISGIMTWLDWRVNPSGQFHGPDGTNWPVVGETMFSWLWPLLLLGAVLLLPLWLWQRYADRR